MKEFNTTAVCIPSKHYMVDTSDRVAEICKLVDAGKYFTINRARQYGKTTTLYLVGISLRDNYEVLNLSFEGISESGFVTEEAFVKAFCRLLRRENRNGLNMPEPVQKEIDEYIKRTAEKAGLTELNDTLLEWCSLSDKPIVMMVDEVDSAMNNQVFWIS